MYSEEPGPQDMNDPAVQEDLFEYLHSTNVNPEELPDAKDRKRYKKWLSSKGLTIP